MARSGRTRRPDVPPAARGAPWEWLGLFALAGLAVYFLQVSWRKWPDPLIDYGRELYIPWRLSEGAVLQRDVEDFYGPLSQYVNALLFRCFGPGLMVLVYANLSVFAGILALLYALLRRAWGAGAAWVGAAVFVSVFAFSQYVGIGNYNYATPYVHATTHGLLVVLALTLVLVRWLEQPSASRSACAGLLLGLTAVLKPEFMLSGAVVTLAAVVLRLRSGGRPGARAVLAWSACLLLPTVAFWLEFARHMGWSDAFLAAGRAWVSVVATSRYSGDPSQLDFLGFTGAGANLVEHGVAVLLGLAVVAVLLAGGRITDRAARPWMRALAAVVVVAGLAWVSGAWIEWIRAGRALLGLSLGYCVASSVQLARAPEAGDGARPVRVLVSLLAVAMLARMLLNGRIFHFGYYQAAIAGALLPAVLVGELPIRFATSRRARTLVVAGALAFLVPGVVSLARRSEGFHRLKTQPVGRGIDRFYAFPSSMSPIAAMVDGASDSLSKLPADRSVLVLPAGAMINYLARRPIPVPETVFFAGTLAEGGESRIVEGLREHPPGSVVLISLDLRDFGVQRYGESAGKGALILAWVEEHYQVSKSLGGDPLEHGRAGLRLLVPRTQR